MKTTKIQTGVSLYIVEDDDSFRETFVDAMSLQGVRVDGARTGAEAFRDLQRRTPSVILIDVQLPDIHGFELCRLLKRSDRLKNVPVVFITASSQYNDARDHVEGLLCGAAAFLPKPITVEQLWAEIEPLLPE